MAEQSGLEIFLALNELDTVDKHKSGKQGRLPFCQH